MRAKIRFVMLCVFTVFAFALCSASAKDNASQVESQNNDGIAAKIEGLEKRLDHGISQLQSQIQAQNQDFANTAYHHLLIATAFMGMATLFVVGITIFTGLNINASRADFREHLTRHGTEFREKLTEQTERSQKEVAQLEKELHDRISEVSASTTSLNDFRNSMQKEFSEKMLEFATMKAGFQPASDIKETVVNEVRAEFQKPETLRHETMRQIILLMLDNPTITEHYKGQLEHELKRLDEPHPRTSGN